jgi:Leucine-rich repeat (LRR) protein
MRIICIMLLVLNISTSLAQRSLDGIEDVYQFTSMEEALAKPDSVFRLKLRAKLTELPAELFSSFPNLVELDLSRNRLKALPTSIGQLKNVKKLIVDRNKLESIPKEIGQMESLQELILNRNELTSIPKEISALKNLYLIDLWSNNLSNLPQSMKNMPNLKEVDLRVIVMSDDQKEEIRELLPNVKVHMDKGCNCK